MSEFKKTMKEFKECGGFVWMIGFMLVVLGTAFAEISTPAWWPSFMASPTVCFTWIGAIVMTIDKVRALERRGIEEIGNKLYRYTENGKEVLMLCTDVYTDNDALTAEDVSTEVYMYWAKAES